jgi:dCTP deaminase
MPTKREVLEQAIITDDRHEALSALRDFGLHHGGVLPDFMIQGMVESGKLKISPFAMFSPEGVISYGLDSYGYNIRCSRHFKVFCPGPHNSIIDPKNLDKRALVDHEGDYCMIPPNSFALAVSEEYMDIPRELLAVVLDKSTYRRCGVIVSATVLEPEWRGQITIEISNTTPLPAKVYANEGIAQVVFLVGFRPCKVSYADRRGRYQDQKGIVLPFVIRDGHEEAQGSGS